jgi:hypothetical protein
VNRNERREVVFERAILRGGTKLPLELRKSDRRVKNRKARAARRRNRGR